MKKLTLILTIMLGLAGLAACSDSDSNGQTLAKSDAGNVTQQEVWDQMKQTPQAKQMMTQMSQQVALKKMLKKEYDVKDEKVQDKLDEMKKQLPTGMNLEDALKQQGMKLEDYKDTIRTQLLLEKAQTKDVKVTDKKLKDYFKNNKKQLESIKVRHIIVNKESKAKDLRKQLKNGKDFAKLAQNNSIGPSKSEGGDLGWITRQSQYQKEFLNAAFKLDVDEISQPVKSQSGWHIIQVTDKKDTFKALKDDITDQYKQSKGKSAQKVIQELFKKYNIEAQNDTFKSAFEISDQQSQQQSGSGSGSSSSDSSDSSK
ncbi:peptidylprolyl isomerase [Tuberibacillus sp. Marseille-P3662]|uniref:peptidylprolyl isomerase n=1 Tax=Tuberibacillus sp. Marseille-P3662 TaxID=1965358 RepID=UPI000A1CD1B1|nr:peptidylprolyl isomerase [Tuberibacillus sp. Marseille-P3662]